MIARYSVLLGAMLLAACQGKRDSEKGAGPSSPVSDAAAGAAAPAPIPDRWWEQPDKHCPRGTTLYGKLPPKGYGVWCADSGRKRNGPRTNFHSNGKKSSEGYERGNRFFGPWTHWHDNGAVRMTLTYAKGGIEHGTFRQWDPSGKLLGTYQMDHGTGTQSRWHDNGQLMWRGEMKAGKRVGEWTHFAPKGIKTRQAAYVDGAPHGLEKRWDRNGKLLVEGSYERGKKHGRWLQYERDSERIAREDVWENGTRVREILYQEGERIGVDPPDQGACADPSGLDAELRKRTGTRPGRRLRCIARPPLFPGLVLVGSFAHDRGCMSEGVLIDCKWHTAISKTGPLLARAGWKKAKGAARIAIARRYVEKVSLAYSGSFDKNVKVSERGGAVTIEGWVARPSGMRRGRTLDRLRFTISKAGVVSRKKLETKRTK